jgi:hypothetical protein
MLVDLQLVDGGGGGAGNVSHFSLRLRDDSLFFLSLDELFFVLVVFFLLDFLFLLIATFELII